MEDASRQIQKPALESAVPVVSVCVPIYNGALHLRECLASIQAQTLRGFEVIIVNDGSTDGSMEIVSEFARHDARFRVHQNVKRLGLVGNWMRCLELARSEWIKFAFQDDVLMPSCLEKLLAACQTHQRRFSFCARNFIFEDGVEPALRSWFDNHARRLAQDYQGRGLIPASLAASIAVADPVHNPVGEPTVTLIHKSLFQELGGFDDTLIQLCDAEFWQRVMVNDGAVFVPETLASYRIHARAATSVNLGQRAYRLGFLDPLVLRYRFAFGPHFRPLRRPSQGGKNVWALRWVCAREASRSLRMAGNDKSCLAEWQAVKSRCAGLGSLARLGWFLELPGRLKRACQFKKAPAIVT